MTTAKERAARIDAAARLIHAERHLTSRRRGVCGRCLDIAAAVADLIAPPARLSSAAYTREDNRAANAIADALNARFGHVPLTVRYGAARVALDLCADDIAASRRRALAGADGGRSDA